jgi:hypothetical protein
MMLLLSMGIEKEELRKFLLWHGKQRLSSLVESEQVENSLVGGWRSHES